MDRALSFEKTQGVVELIARQQRKRADVELPLQHGVHRAETQFAVITGESIGDLGDDRAELPFLRTVDMPLVGFDRSPLHVSGRGHDVPTSHLHGIVATVHANGRKSCRMGVRQGGGQLLNQSNQGRSIPGPVRTLGFNLHSFAYSLGIKEPLHDLIYERIRDEWPLVSNELRRIEGIPEAKR